MSTSRLSQLFRLLVLVATVSSLLVMPSAAMTIKVTYDSSVTSSPYSAQIQSTVNYVVQFFETTYTNPVTVNIHVGWGEANGAALSSGTLGQSYFVLDTSYTLSEIEQALLANPQSAADRSAYAHFPPISLYAGTNGFWATTAQEQALGLVPASSTSINGWVGFNSGFSYTFNNANGVANGTYDFQGIVAHEISEVLGRDSGVGGSLGPSVLDLFRYSAPKTAVFANVTSYFSIDGGTTDLRDFNTASGGDTGDWSGAALDAGDAADAFAYSGVILSFSQPDITTLEVVGWSTVSQSSPVGGQCGSSSGAVLTSAPTTNLCNAGTPSSVSGSGPWSWSCAGSNGGASAQCSAQLEINGACGSANGTNVTTAPTSNLCTAGTASPVTGSGPFGWSCAGSNGGVTASCSAQLEINGSCGSANGVPVSTVPTTSLCSVGTASSVSGSGPWSWSCTGSNGDLTASCSAPLSGGGGISPDGTILSAPSSANLTTAAGTWTFGAAQQSGQPGQYQIFLNGSTNNWPAGQGYAAKLEVANGGRLYTYNSYVNGWWVWSGTSWSSSSPPPGGGGSPDGTILTAPSSASLTTAAGTWTFGTAQQSGEPGEYQILLNGSTNKWPAGQGYAAKLEVANGGRLYTYNSYVNGWWVWSGTGWTGVSGP